VGSGQASLRILNVFGAVSKHNLSPLPLKKEEKAWMIFLSLACTCAGIVTVNYGCDTFGIYRSIVKK